MATRPHYEIYQENMIQRKHGFPQFSADPEGNSSLSRMNGAAQVRLGDLGYFSEGRFFRLESLDVERIVGTENFRISWERIPFDKPECAGNVKKVEVEGGISTTDPSGITSIGGGGRLKIQCTRGEGAILNLESGNALYTYFEKTTKVFLGEYMLAFYKNWMKNKPYGRALNAHDLFLVTGTYMTKNWEAATFVHDSKSIGAGVSVDAVLAGGNVSIDWSTWTPSDRGFRLGHVHTGVGYPDQYSVTSFGACCHTCEPIPENQCIFLRGWRIREMFQFADSSLVAPISVENVKKVEWRRTQLIRKQPSMKSDLATPIEGSSRRSIAGLSLKVDQISKMIINDTGAVHLQEGEGAPKDSNHGDLYDFVALLKYKVESRAVIPVHDDDVIALLNDENHSAYVVIGPPPSNQKVHVSTSHGTRIQLHSIFLQPLQTLGQTVLINMKLISSILVENKVIHKSEPTFWSKSNRSWTFKIRFDVPQSCSCFVIDISNSSPDQSLNFHFEPLVVELRDMVSNAGGKDCSSLTAQISTPDDCAFQLCVGFTAQNLLVFPLNVCEIEDTLRAMFQEGASINVYDLTTIYDSVQNLQITNRNRSRFLNLMGDIYMKQYDGSHSVKDVTKAVDIYHQALQDAIKNGDQMTLQVYMFDYSRSLLARYECLGEVSDLSNSIVKFQEAVQLNPNGHPFMPSQLNSHRISLTRWSQQAGEVSNLNDSIAKFQEVAWMTSDGHPDKYSWLTSLAISLLSQFEQKEDLDDLDESIRLQMWALDLRPTPHPDQSTSLNNLANALYTRFEQKRDFGDLGEAIRFHREALDLRPAPHPDRSISLNNLASALYTQFVQKGDFEDLEESIRFHREALDLRPIPHPDRSTSLNNLASVLSTRFEQKGDSGDLEESIRFHKEALDLSVKAGQNDQLLPEGEMPEGQMNRQRQVGGPSLLSEGMDEFDATSRSSMSSIVSKSTMKSRIGRDEMGCKGTSP